MSRHVHLWHRYHAPDWFDAWCGKVLATDQPVASEGSDHVQATCLHCLRCFRDHHIRRAAWSAQMVEEYTEQLEAELRRRRKRARARSRPGA